MLDQLPVELVRYIVQIIAPIEYRYTTYPDRQAVLLSLCLTSKLLREIAQPLLFSVVCLAGKVQYDAFERSRSLIAPDRSLEDVQVVVLDGSRSGTYETYASDVRSSMRDGQLRELLEGLSSLRDVSFSSGEIHDLGAFNNTNLVKLHLAKLFLFSHPGVSFPHLLELSLVAVEVEDEETVTRSVFPSLVHFSYGEDVHDYRVLDTKLLIKYLVEFPSSSLELDVVRRPGLPLDAIRQHSSRILYSMRDWTDFEVFKDRGDLVQHLRISLDDKWIYTLRYLTPFLSTEDHSPLCTVFLPSKLSQDSHSLQDLQEMTSKLIEVCTNRRIEVVVEEQSTDNRLQSPISPKFVRRAMKDLRM